MSLPTTVPNYGPGDPVQNLVPLTLANTPIPVCKGIMCGTAGTLNGIDELGNVFTGFPLQLGHNPIRLSQVSTGGSAANLWGLYGGGISPQILPLGGGTSGGVTPPAIGQPISFLPLNATSTPNVSPGQQPALNFERTQPWTAIAKINVATPPTASANPAAIIFTTANQGAANGLFPGYELWIDGTGKLRVRLINNISAPNYIGVIGTTNVCDGVTRTVAASYDGSSTVAGVKIYVNGILETMTSEGTALTASILNIQPLVIGNQLGFPFSLGGTLAEFSLSNVVRSQAQIAAYTTATAAVDVNTVLAYNFSENTSWHTADLSSNAFTGYLNSAKWQSGIVGVAPHQVQGKMSFTTAASATIPLTLTSPVASGNALCVTVDVAGTNTLNVAVTDNMGNIYTLVHKNASFSGVIFATYYCANITNGPTVITATISSGTGTFWSIAADEFAGVKQIAAPLDGFADLFNATTPNTANGATSGSFTTTSNFDLIYSPTANYVGEVITAGSGFTILENGFTQGINTQYRLQSVAGALAATATIATAGQMHIAGFALQTTP
jgi:Concanavalin A-like lectin/glucanases superfamily